MNEAPYRVRPFYASILLVEEDPRDRSLLRRALAALPRRLGADVASDVVEAIAYLRRAMEDGGRTTPAAILTDVHLPGRPGWDLLEWAARHRALSAVPRLVWTSLPNPEGEDRARALRAVRYVAKPRDPAGYRRIARLLADYLGD